MPYSSFSSSRLSARILSLGGTAAVALAQGATQTYRLITPELALLATFHPGVFEERRGLLEYNVIFFREGVQEIAVVERDARAGNLQVHILSTSVSTNIHARGEHRRRVHGTTCSSSPGCAHTHPNGRRHTPRCLRSVRLM
jgi:hypothetical protein